MKKIIFLFLLTSNILFAQPGALDASLSAFSTANGAIYTTLTQPDGKIIIGGAFTSVNGSTSNRIARLNADGSKDASFTLNLAAGATSVRALGFQSDGKIIVAGEFVTVDGNPVPNRIIRLNADGTFDATFNSGGSGALGGSILAIAIDSSDKIVIGGTFTSYNGTLLNRITRLNADGTLDGTFAVGTGVTSSVTAIKIQPDFKIVISGNFVSYNGTSRSRIARLNTNGAIDATFMPVSANRAINAIALQADGKIVCGGLFDNYAGDLNKKYLIRINADGSHDATFNSYGFDDAVNYIAIDDNNKVLVAGKFTSYNGIAKSRITRLLANGALDTSFNPSGANDEIFTAITQNDGKLLVGGSFTTFNGVAKVRLVKLNAYYSISLLAASCGATLPTLTSSVYAEYISGLQAYRFKVTNTTTSAVQIFERPVNNLALSSIPGMAYNTQYKIEVAAKINNAWEPYYGKPCFVNSPNPVSNINPAQCGQFLTAMNQWVTTDYVLNVTAYKFRVTNLTTPSPVQEIITSANKFNMTQLASRSFDSEYLVEVALKNTDGTFLPYGPSTCTIKTPKFPQTQVVESQCEGTVANMGTMVNADYVANATVYRFFITNEALEFSATLDRSLNKFNFSMLPGVTPGASYTVLVAVKIDGVFGPYGKACTVFLPGLAKITSTKDTKQQFEVVSYPNPFSSDFKLQLQTSSNETVAVTVYDMLGRKVQDQHFSVSDLENATLGNDLPSGVYTAVIQQGQDSKAVRIVKR